MQLNVWRGAFPRTIPGMHIGVAHFCLHVSMFLQAEFMRSFEAKLADDCSDPAR